MSLKKCDECGASVSTEAPACPKCGARPPKPTSRFTLVVGGLFAIGVAQAVLREPSTPNIAAAAPSASATPSPRDRQRGEVAMAVKVIRKSLHDPASFELDDATFMPNGAGCYTYRAKNGFGALRVLRAVLTPERMLVTADQPAKLFAPVWNEYCAERSGEALTAYIRQNVL